MASGATLMEEASGDDVLVTFEHPFFTRLDTAYFRISDHTGRPALMVHLNEMEAALPLPGIKAELNLSDNSHDGQMLNMVARALKFVKFLYIGDPMPTEVTTGEASWKPGKRHREMAERRLTTRLIEWFKEAEGKAAETEAEGGAADPDARARVRAAFRAVAKRIGIAEDDEAGLTERMEQLIEELSYIEALREMASGIGKMREKAKALSRLHARERSVVESLNSLDRMFRAALDEFRQHFAAADQRHADVLAMLESPDEACAAIRGDRDELYCRISAWDEILPRWQELVVMRGGLSGELLHDTMRFLSRRYMQAEEWVLTTQSSSSPKPKDRFASAMTW